MSKSTVKREPIQLSFVYDQVGSDFFIGIYGEKDEIEQAYNTAYNFEITGGELHWLHDNFAYYGTSRARLVSGYESALIDQLRRESGLLEATAALTKAGRKIASEFLRNMPRESFIENLRAKRELF